VRRERRQEERGKGKQQREQEQKKANGREFFFFSIPLLYCLSSFLRVTLTLGSALLYTRSVKLLPTGTSLSGSGWVRSPIKMRKEFGEREAKAEEGGLVPVMLCSL
jgi:hypothetical protein